MILLSLQLRLVAVVVLVVVVVVVVVVLIVFPLLFYHPTYECEVHPKIGAPASR